MANQIAIKAHTRPMDEVICDEMSHIFQYEVAGYAFHSGVGVNLLHGENGIINADMIEKAVKPKADWLPVSRLVVLENTCNKGGGSLYRLTEMKDIHHTCRRLGLALHLDGARLMNALVETGDDAKAVGACFDSISLCLSKGLGAPVGSVLTGGKDFIADARRIRKAYGGGMRQAGYLAAAGIYALDHHVERLREDHEHARRLAIALQSLDWVTAIRPVATNIVIFDIDEKLSTSQVLGFLAENGVKASAFGPKTIRFVTHLDVSGEQIELTIKALRLFTA